MRLNVISAVLTQLQLPVMSSEPICAPACFSSPPLLHSHRTKAFNTLTLWVSKNEILLRLETIFEDKTGS